MSATINIEATGVGKTVKDIKSVESALERMGRTAVRSMPDGMFGSKMSANNPFAKGQGQSDKRGMALLAASQAFEDAQYGIRGVLNNIPQMMMFAGASATMTSAVSVLAVSLSVVGPHLFTVSKALDAAAASGKRAEAFAAALKSVNDAMFDFDLSKWSEDQAKTAEQSMDALTKSIMRPREALADFGKGLDAFASKNKILRDLSNKTSELFAPKEGSQVRAASFESNDIKNELTVAQKKLKETEDAIARLESRVPFITNPASAMGAMSDSEYRAKFQEAQTAAAFAKTNLEDAQKAADALEKKLGGGMKTAENSIVNIGNELNKSKLGDIIKMVSPAALAIGEVTARSSSTAANSFNDDAATLKTAKAKIAATKEVAEQAEKSLKTLEAQKALQDRYGSNYDKAVEAAKKEFEALGDANRAAREAVELEEAKLAAQQKYIAGLAVVAAEDKLRKTIDDGHDRLPSGNLFLSSKGRIGGSAAESRNALGVINYQRQANSILTQIARNTLTLAKKDMAAVWGK